MKPVMAIIAFAAALAAGAAFEAVSAPSSHPADRLGTISIYFPSGATMLTDEAKAVLDEAAQVAKDSNAVRVMVVGYDDAPGNAETSQQIATERAASVGHSLVDRGIDPSIVSVAAAANPAEPTTETRAAFIDARRADVIIEPSKAVGITSGF